MRHHDVTPPLRTLALIGLLFGLASPISAQFLQGSDNVRWSWIGAPSDTHQDAFEVATAYSPAQDLHLVVWVADDTDFGTVDGEDEVYGVMIDGTTGQPVSAVARLTWVGPMADASRAPVNPAVSWEPETGSFLVLWAAADGDFGLLAGQREIFGLRTTWHQEGGWSVGSPVRISYSDHGSGVTDRAALAPAAAYGRVQKQWMIVWESDAAGGPVDNENEIWARPMSVLDLTFPRSEGRVSEVGSDGDLDADAYDPAIAYHQASDSFYVVWSADDIGGAWVDGHFEIQGRWLSAATGDPTSLTFGVSSLGDLGDPAISAFDPSVAYSPSMDAFLVLFEVDGYWPAVRREVYGFLAPATGLVLPGSDRISEMGPDGVYAYAANPQVVWDPHGRQFVASWRGYTSDVEAFAARGGAAPWADWETWGRSIVYTPTGRELGPQVRMSASGDGAALPEDYDVWHHALGVGAEGALLAVWSGEDDRDEMVNNENEVFGELVGGAAIFRDGFETGTATRWSGP